MNILLAPDSFKGCLSAIEVADAIERGILKSNPRDIYIKKQALADGGEGTAEVIGNSRNWQKCTCTTVDALGSKVEAHYYANSQHKMAVLDMASASGIMHIEESERNILMANTFGTGLLIKNAIDKGVRKCVIGLGGSATSDMGLGLAATLGYRFFAKNGLEILPIPKNFGHIESIVLPKKKVDITFEALFDVNIPLLGSQGSVQKYAQQKGATKADIQFLETNMAHVKNIMLNHFAPLKDENEGDGAAGGLGFGLRLFFAAKLLNGFYKVTTETKLAQQIDQADIVVGGEGSLDQQTLDGKVLHGLARLCRAKNKKLIVVCGMASEPDFLQQKLNAKEIFSLQKQANNLQDSIENAAWYLEEIGNKIALKYL